MGSPELNHRTLRDVPHLALDKAGLVHPCGWWWSEHMGNSWESIYGASLPSDSIFSLKQEAEWVGDMGEFEKKA